MKRTLIITTSILGLLVASCGGASVSADGSNAGGEAAMEFRKEVQIVDFSAAIEVLGQERPSAEDPEAVREFYHALVLESDPPIMVGVAGFDQGFEIESWREEFGFSFLDVDRAVLSGTPPSELFAVHGPISAESIDAAVRADPTWSDYLTEVTHEGQPVFLWSDPIEESPERSAPRPLSRGGALAVVGDETVLRSVDPDVVKGALDCVAGAKGSLADSPAFASVANMLDTHGAYSAILTNDLYTLSYADFLRDTGFEPPTEEQEADRLNEVPTLPPYQALGLGQAFDDAGVHCSSSPLRCPIPTRLQ